MRNLDLATFGVEEMSEVQMQEIDGGWGVVLPFVVGAVFGGMLYDLINDPKGTADAFNNGRSIAHDIMK